MRGGFNFDEIRNKCRVIKKTGILIFFDASKHWIVLKVRVDSFLILFDSCYKQFRAKFALLKLLFISFQSVFLIK